MPRRYDVVFVGSLLTHLPPPRDTALIRALASALADGGLLVFSTQGRSCLEHLDWYGSRFRAVEPFYREQVARNGWCFYPYDAGGGYGITIHSREYLQEEVVRVGDGGLRLVRFAERGWDSHQDVWTYQRGATSG